MSRCDIDEPDAPMGGETPSDGFTGASLRPRIRSLDVRTYRDARDLFAAVEDAARERRDILRELGKMEAREGVRAQSYEPMSRFGSVSDRMAATDARVDYEGEKGPILEQDDALIALAESLIWGPSGGDMTGGVLHVMGYRSAKAIERHYVHLVPFPALAREWGMSESQCRRIADKGLDAMDYLGWVGAVRGVGRAEG